MDGAAARNRDIAVCGIRRDAVAVDGHIHIIADEDIALFHLRQDARIVEAREDILAVERNAPFVRMRTCNLEIAVDADIRFLACLVGLLSVAVALLDGDTVAAKPARHRDIERGVDGD